jgi:hypothetical protein
MGETTFVAMALYLLLPSDYTSSIICTTMKIALIASLLTGAAAFAPAQKVRTKRREIS